MRRFRAIGRVEGVRLSAAPQAEKHGVRPSLLNIAFITAGVVKAMAALNPER
jgi:hypothetical protein